MPPRIRSAGGRQALYDLRQCFIDWSSWTAEQFFEIVALDIQTAFTDALLDSEQDRDDEIWYASTAHRFGISGIIKLQHGDFFI